MIGTAFAVFFTSPNDCLGKSGIPAHARERSLVDAHALLPKLRATTALRGAFLVALALATPCISIAAPWVGAVHGTVRYLDGSVLSGVDVKVTSGPSRSSHTFTNSDGTYLFLGLQPGRYELSFARSGYDTRLARFEL